MATIMEKDVLLEMAHLGHLLPDDNEITEEMDNDLTAMGKLWNEIMFTSCEEINFKEKVEEIKKLRAKYEKEAGKATINIRQNKYLNNLVEQDHRGIKKITKPMMGFKSFYSARRVLAGIELCHMLRKGQYDQEQSANAWEYFYSLAG